MSDLPKLWEIAEARLESASPRDKTINIKVTINTARMMVEEEKRRDKAISVLAELAALVRGECPSLLNEDSGGDANLDAEINAVLQPNSQP